MHDVMTPHKVARFEHLPNYFLCFKWLDARVIVAALKLVKYCPV